MRFKRTNIQYSGRNKYTQTGGGNKYSRKSRTYGTNSGGAGGGWTPSPLPVPTGNTNNIWYSNGQVADVEINVPASYIEPSQLTSGHTIDIPINGFANNEATEVWIGGLDSGETNHSISGITSGMSVNVTDNGTTLPILHLTLTTAVTQTSGELLIPVFVNTSTYLEIWSATTAEWKRMDGLSKVKRRVIAYTWTIKSSGGGSGYILDLTNENASVTADEQGNIYSASVTTLRSKAILYYNNLPATGVRYSVCATTGTVGYEINPANGTLKFIVDSFSFTGDSTNIFVTATCDGITMSKTMRITKIKDSGGVSATIRWVIPSTNTITKAIDGTLTPSAITVTVLKQTGGNPAEVDSATTAFYGYAPNNLNPTIEVPNTGVTVSSDWEYMVIALREGNTSSGLIYEQETVPVLSESSGPSLRGPIMWKSSLARRFSNGVGPLPTDADFLDIIRYNMHTYKCITSYTQVSGATWSSVSSNWQLDDSYDFVASTVDLAQNEVIQIKPTNAIQIINNLGQQTGEINTSHILFGGTNLYNADFAVQGGIQYASAVVSRQVVHSPLFQSDFVEDRSVKAMMSPFKMTTMISTDEQNYFEQDWEGDNWFFMGMDTEISYHEFPYIREIGSEEIHEELLEYKGFWIASTSGEPDPDEDYRFIGAVSSNAERKPYIIYLNVT